MYVIYENIQRIPTLRLKNEKHDTTIPLFSILKVEKKKKAKLRTSQNSATDRSLLSRYMRTLFLRGTLIGRKGKRIYLDHDGRLRLKCSL